MKRLNRHLFSTLITELATYNCGELQVTAAAHSPKIASDDCN